MIGMFPISKIVKKIPTKCSVERRPSKDSYIMQAVL